MASNYRRGSRDRSGSFSRGDGYMSTTQTARQLRELGDGVLEAAKAALKEGVDEIVADIKTRAPHRTGKLEESVEAKANGDGTSYNITIDAKNKRNISYAQFVEFDPRIGGSPTGRFIYPTFERHKVEVYRKIQEAIRDAMNNGD